MAASTAATTAAAASTAVELDQVEEVQLPHGKEEEDDEGRPERIPRVGLAGNDDDRFRRRTAQERDRLSSEDVINYAKVSVFRASI